MELRPVKERKKNLYPTNSDSKKTNFIKYFPAISPEVLNNSTMIPVAVPSYMTQLQISKAIRNNALFIMIIFLILLIKNKIKMKQIINENNEEATKKIKKYIKINWVFLIISAIVVITMIIRIQIIKN